MKSISAISILLFAIAIASHSTASARAKQSRILTIDLISRDFHVSTRLSLNPQEMIAWSSAFRCTIRDSVALLFFDERLRRKRTPVIEKFGMDSKIVCIVTRENGVVDTVDFGLGYMRIGSKRFEQDEILLWFIGSWLPEHQLATLYQELDIIRYERAAGK
ncbi:MAG: hypothetical protein ABIQ57_09010 [Candidatus Kapaibacterium sp.]